MSWLSAIGERQTLLGPGVLQNLELCGLRGRLLNERRSGPQPLGDEYVQVRCDFERAPEVLREGDRSASLAF